MFWNNIEQEKWLKRAFNGMKENIIYTVKTLGYYTFMVFMFPAIVMVWIMEQYDII